jgi:hypothetical protein
MQTHAVGLSHRGSNNNTISREVAKRLEPTHAIGLKCVLFEEGRVESVSVINEFLKIFQGNLGSEGRPPQVLEKAIETICPQADDNVVFVGYFQSEVGMPDAKEISRRLSIISESIKGETHRGDTACASRPLSPISPPRSHSVLSVTWNLT